MGCIQLHAVLLFDVGISPVDADERQHALQSLCWNRTLQEGLALERTNHRLTEAVAQLGALAAGEVCEVEHKAEPLHVEGFDAVFEQHLASNGIDVIAEEYPAAVQADGMDVDDAVAAGEVMLEAVAVAARDENGAVRSAFLDARGIDFLKEIGLDEAFGQHKLGIQVFHLRALVVVGWDW